MANSLSGRVPEKLGTCKKREEGMGSIEEEFVGLVHKSIPNWTSVWKILLTGSKTLRKRLYERENPVVLEKKIRMKISELVREEEALVSLYEKAAEVARKREEEFRGKTAFLMKQIEKDKNLIKTFKQVN